MGVRLDLKLNFPHKVYLVTSKFIHQNTFQLYIEYTKSSDKEYEKSGRSSLILSGSFFVSPSS